MREVKVERSREILLWEKGNNNSLIMDGQCFSRYHLVAMFESVCYNLYEDGFQTLCYPDLFL